MSAPQSDDDEEALMRAQADLELLTAAYPDEITIHTPLPCTSFPISFTMHLQSTNEASSKAIKDSKSTITMQMKSGYPETTGVEITTFRAIRKKSIELAVQAVKDASLECLANGEESALSCCIAAQQVWDECMQDEADKLVWEEERLKEEEHVRLDLATQDDDIKWISGVEGCGIVHDRKSTFQAFVCYVKDEDMVRRALRKLIDGNNKIQRATHNMYAYRFTEILTNKQQSKGDLDNSEKTKTHILKHDNDDDGEDGAGRRLAQLLATREDDGVLVVVSRWFGGIHLGPKRFAHIINVARELLVKCYEDGF